MAEEQAERFKRGVDLQSERVTILEKLGFTIVRKGLHHFTLTKNITEWKKCVCRVDYWEIDWIINYSPGKPLNDPSINYWGVTSLDSSFEDVFELLTPEQQQVAIFNLELLA